MNSRTSTPGWRRRRQGRRVVVVGQSRRDHARQPPHRLHLPVEGRVRSEAARRAGVRHERPWLEKTAVAGGETALPNSTGIDPSDHRAGHGGVRSPPDQSAVRRESQGPVPRGAGLRVFGRVIARPLWPDRDAAEHRRRRIPRVADMVASDRRDPIRSGAGLLRRWLPAGAHLLTSIQWQFRSGVSSCWVGTLPGSAGRSSRTVTRSVCRSGRPSHAVGVLPASRFWRPHASSSAGSPRATGCWSRSRQSVC